MHTSCKLHALLVTFAQIYANHTTQLSKQVLSYIETDTFLDLNWCWSCKAFIGGSYMQEKLGYITEDP